MPLRDPARNTLLLERMMEQPAARWAELFLEARWVVTIRAGGGVISSRSEAFDSGAGLRIVGADGGWRQASAGGGLNLAPEQALRSLVGGSGIVPRTAGAASDPSGTPAAWTGPEAETGLLVAWMEEVMSLAPVTLRGVLSRQEVTHQSTDSASVSDVRQGVVVEVRIRGGEARQEIPPRRLAAWNVEGLRRRHPPERLAAELGEEAELARGRRAAPDGESAIVFAPGSPGILVHESVGHLLEGGGAAGPGAEWGCGEPPRVSPLLSVVDDPAGVAGHGAYLVDDEGVAPKRVLLLDRGRFIGRVTDRWSSRSTLTSTGHGRRQSYRDAPMPRLRATLAMAGTDDPAEIVRTTREGIYVQEVSRGQCDPASGDFVIQATCGRMIEQGRLTRALREFLLIGNSHDALSGVDRVGFDVADDGGAYSCVRGGQALPVIVGLPTLRIARLKVCSLAVA